MKITKKIDSKTAKMQFSIQNNLFNTESPLFCSKCHIKLGLLRMLRRSIFTKKGSEYVVKCKSCGSANKRIKGQMGEKINQEWEKTGY
ncbi:MAG: hypothetical protein BV457_01565 [Thermoplasmata archaeon M9B1D]|nr:MAG: hypothetical protein BV457_01565 [Thermoplasmata archaeon M9B1D]